MSLDKPSLRRQLRTRRKALSPAQQRAAAHALCRLVVKQLLFVRSRDIGFYLANDGEIDPSPLLLQAARMHKRCYLPVLAAGQQLRFARYAPGEPLRANRYGIGEPTTRARRKAWTLSLILLPLVGFDRAGNRLGMGGGYYDRSLMRLRNADRPARVGLAHGCQEVEALPRDEWDVPLAAIATDAEWIAVKKLSAR